MPFHHGDVNRWYRRRESNPQHSVSETETSANWDTSALVRVGGFEPPSLPSEGSDLAVELYPGTARGNRTRLILLVTQVQSLDYERRARDAVDHP